MIQYRNSFLPQINGKIQNENNGTQIQVTMSLHAFVFFFLNSLVLICPDFLHRCLYKTIREKEISVELFLPLGMLLFVYTLTMAGFKSESKQAKEYLRRSFDAEIIKE